LEEQMAFVVGLLWITSLVPSLSLSLNLYKFYDSIYIREEGRQQHTSHKIDNSIDL